MSEWTKDEIKLLKDNYKTKTMKELSELLGRSETSIRAKKTRLGLVKVNRPFTESEIQILVQWYETHGQNSMELDELVKILGRNKQVISRKARKFGLTCNNRPSSDRQKMNMSIAQKAYAKEHPYTEERRNQASIKARGVHYGDVSYKKIRDAWRNMLRRCYVPEEPSYHNYGGRGIAVCDEWQGEDEFDNFYKWAIKNGHDLNLTLDRIDNNLDYSPNNCRWVSMKEQGRNKRTNRLLEFDGQVFTVAEWSERTGIPRNYINYHLYRNRGLDDIIERYSNYIQHKSNNSK